MSGNYNFSTTSEDSSPTYNYYQISAGAPLSSGNYSRVNSSNAQSITDLRPVGSDSFLGTLSSAEVSHQRSKSSDAQPAPQPIESPDDYMDWTTVVPLKNRAYIPLQESIHRTNRAKNDANDSVVVERVTVKAKDTR